MRFVVAIILIEICMNVAEHEKSKLQHRKNQILLKTGMKPNKIFNIKASYTLEYIRITSEDVVFKNSNESRFMSKKKR